MREGFEHRARDLFPALVVLTLEDLARALPNDLDEPGIEVTIRVELLQRLDDPIRHRLQSVDFEALVVEAVEEILVLGLDLRQKALERGEFLLQPAKHGTHFGSVVEIALQGAVARGWFWC